MERGRFHGAKACVRAHDRLHAGSVHWGHLVWSCGYVVEPCFSLMCCSGSVKEARRLIFTQKQELPVSFEVLV